MNEAIQQQGPETAPQAVRLPEISVVVPTFNERDNVAGAVRAAGGGRGGDAWEVVFVDDNSPDGTAAVARELGATRPRACAASAASAAAALPAPASRACSAARRPIVAVMDADLQHDETHAADDAGAAARRRGRSRGRQPLRRRRRGRRLRPARAAISRARDRARAPPARRRAHRSDERLLHDAPRPLRGDGAEALDARLQDPARHRRDRPRPLRIERSAFTFGARQHGESKLDCTGGARISSGCCWRSSPATRSRSASFCSRSSARSASSCI